jgi:hypothetical protein
MDDGLHVAYVLRMLCINMVVRLDSDTLDIIGGKNTPFPFGWPEIIFELSNSMEIKRRCDPD